MPGPVDFRAPAFLAGAFFAVFRRVDAVAFFIADRAVLVAELAALPTFPLALRAAWAAAVRASSAIFPALRTVLPTVVAGRAVSGERFEVRLRLVPAAMETSLSEVLR